MSQAAASAAGSLPPVISEYLAASDRGDAEAVVRCFAEDAVVVDEGRHTGVRSGRVLTTPA